VVRQSPLEYESLTPESAECRWSSPGFARVAVQNPCLSEHRAPRRSDDITVAWAGGRRAELNRYHEISPPACGVVLAEQNDEWAEVRRHMSYESLTKGAAHSDR
jgi:hypothetical protein